MAFADLKHVVRAVCILSAFVYYSDAASTTMRMDFTPATSMPTPLPCDDIDSNACQLMHKNRPDLCSDPTLANAACKRYCGKCPIECYTCSALVKDMSECNGTMFCDVGQDCYTMEVFDFDQNHGFRGGCIDQNLCLPQGDGQNMFGRSSSDVHMKCCDTDRCNSQDLTTTTKPATTHSLLCYDKAPDCQDLGRFACIIEEHACKKTCGLC